MSKINLIEAFAAGFKGLSRFIIEFPTEQKEFIKGLRFSLAHTARKKYPDKCVSELSHTTGLLRAQIDDALDEDFPVPVMDKESIILGDLWRNRDKNNLIPIHGKHPSFYSIATELLKNKYSTVSVMETLIKSGTVQKQDDHLLILHHSFAPNKDEERIINQTGLIIDRFISTMIHNKHANKSNLNYQSTYKSTKIPLSKREALNKEIYMYLQKLAMPGVREIFEKYEANVPNGHYPEFGVSIFKFDSEKGKKT